MERVLVYGMTDNPGGIESYLVGMSEKIKKHSIQFDFVSDFPSVAYAEKLKRDGAKIFFIPAKGKRLLRHIKALYRILKEHPEYKIVYFNILDAGAVFTAAVPWSMGRKIVTHSHNGSTEKVILHKVCRPFLNWITDCRVACSQLAAEYMFGKRKKSSALIIHNAIHAEKYYFDKKTRLTYRRKLGVEDKFVICHVGRMTEQKNPFRLLDIFDALYDIDSDAVLLYIGRGELEEKIREYAKNKKSSENIRFLGVCPDVAALMQASDVFLLPSVYEGLPIVAIEAQAAGLPVVLSSNITSETDITGNLCFLDLNKSNQDWAKAIMKYKKKIRLDCRELIKSSGYALENSNGEDMLAKCFK